MEQNGETGHSLGSASRNQPLPDSWHLRHDGLSPQLWASSLSGIFVIAIRQGTNIPSRPLPAELHVSRALDRRQAQIPHLPVHPAALWCLDDVAGCFCTDCSVSQEHGSLVQFLTCFSRRLLARVHGLDWKPACEYTEKETAHNLNSPVQGWVWGCMCVWRKGTLKKVFVLKS